MNKKAKWILVNLPELIAAIALTVAVTDTVVNAFTRYVLGFTYSGSSEIVSIAFVWTIFPGAAAAYKKGMHYGIDLVIMKLPPSVRRVAKVLSRLFIVVVLGIMAYLSFLLLKQVGTKKMPATYISYFWYDLPAVLSFIFMAIYSVYQLIKEIQNPSEKTEA